MGKLKIHSPYVVMEIIEKFNLLKSREYVNPLFEFLKYRKKRTSSTSSNSFEKFGHLFEHEKQFNITLLKMKAELDQLYEITPPYIKNVIQLQILDDLKKVNGTVTKRNLIDTFKKSNEDTFQFVRKSVKDYPGQYYEIFRAREKNDGKIDLRYIESPIFDDYIDILNIYLESILTACFRSSNINLIQKEINDPSKTFVNTIRQNNILTTSGERASNYEELQLKHVINDMDKFIEICDHFSEEQKFKLENKLFNFRFITKNKTEYRWNKYKGAIVRYLRYFIYMLQDEEIFDFNNYDKVRIANAFLSFFHVQDEISDSNYVFKNFEDVKQYKAFFKYTDQPQVTPQ